MKVQNFKRALLLCAAIGANNLSWAGTDNIFDCNPGTVNAFPSGRAVMYNSASPQTAFTAAVTGPATTLGTLLIDGPNDVLINTTAWNTNSATSNFIIDVTKNVKTTFVGAVQVAAPIISSGGGDIAFSGAAPVITTTYSHANAPTGYASWAAFYNANPLYKASTTSVATAAAAQTAPQILDVAKSLTLDLSGVTAGGYIFPLDFALQAGQTLTILGSTSAANVADIYTFSGAIRGSGNIIVKGYGVFKFTGTATDFTGDLSISSTNATDYTAATPAMTLYKPALNFTSGVYASDLSIPANTYQVINLAANSLISGTVSGPGNLLVHSGTAAQHTLRLTADNSSWTGGLVLGNGATASSYGPKIQVEHVNALGASTATGGITLSFGVTQVAAPILAFKANATTARTINVAGTNTTANALTIHTFDGFTTNFNGIISGTSGNGDALRLTGEGTTNLNAANTHAPSSSASYATYVTGGGVVGMGTATSLGYNATSNLTGVFLDDGIQLTVPQTSVTIANPLTLHQGAITITAPASGATTTFTGVKSGPGGLIRGAGAGAWIESAAHTYTGGFTSSVSGATINVGVDSVAGTSSALGNGTISLGGGTLAFTGAYSLNTGNIAVTAALTIDDGGHSVNIPANISGVGPITKKGTTGTLKLTPVTGNTFTSAIINHGGTVEAGNSKAVAGTTNNVTLKGNPVVSGLKSSYLPYGAANSIKNTGTTDMTVQVQGS